MAEENAEKRDKFDAFTTEGESPGFIRLMQARSGSKAGLRRKPNW